MTSQKILLAGGCFWGMEEILRHIPGVLYTEVGYCGGDFENPRYQDVVKGNTGHAETVLVEFDADKITIKNLLYFFFRMHDPTYLNRQGNDIGTQYRSAIFYDDENQKIAALEVIKELNELKKWQRPIVTEVVKAKTFFPAEDYHQDYLQKNPNGYSCHWLRDF